MEAVFLGVIPYSSAISFAIGFAITIATVLLAVANVHSSYQKSHSKLSAFLSAENFMDPAKKCIESTILTDQRTHGCYKDSHHAGLEHSGNAGADISQELHRCDMSSKKQ